MSDDCAPRIARGYQYADRFNGGGWSANLGCRAAIPEWMEALARYSDLKRQLTGDPMGNRLEILWRSESGKRWRVVWPLTPLRLIALAARGKVPPEMIEPDQGKTGS